jgi:(1->4)-alpha-D-glucan 1-alpha-D-glucosylmutase
MTGLSSAYDSVVDDAKRDVLSTVLAADVRRVTNRFVAVCESQPRWRDFTRHRLADAITEIVVAFDVYRSYVTEEGEVDSEDEAVIRRALARVESRRPDLGSDLVGFFRAVLLGDLPGAEATEARMQLQQLTVPAAAKGVEDTAFYRYLRFAALNEVGGAPDRFGSTGVGEFHEWAREVQQRWPRTMLALSTHDTKRSEDVRARLYVLSEMPDEWGALVRGWMARHERHRLGRDRPDRNAEYLLYQTLVGTAPVSRKRVLAYMTKACREAKVHTSWLDPHPEYEASLAAFVDALYDDRVFLDELGAFVDSLKEFGRVTSLAQKLLQLTAPGVPDVYQGTELWDLSLVDPDNRRPVDHARRRALLDRLDGFDWAGLGTRDDEGLRKLWLHRQALAVRAARPEAFGVRGSYRPLDVRGVASHHVVAFMRGDEVITLVPRLVVGLARRGGFRETRVELPPGRWIDELSGRVHRGGSVELRALLSPAPVALLVKEVG